MTTTVSVAPAPDEARELRRVSRRRERYAARHILWNTSYREDGKNSRQAYCGRFEHNEVGVVVKASGSVADGTRRAGLGGVQSCGSVWACPVCSEKIQAERQKEVSAALLAWLGVEAHQVTFLTLTMRHHAGQRLADLWGALSHAWARTTSSAGRHWKADKEEFGIAHYLRVVEVTHGLNGWHVHVHCLLFHDKPVQEFELAALRARLFGRWQKALRSRGLDAWERVGIDLRRVENGDALGEYFAKTTYRATSTEGAAFEVTGSASKRAGAGRTPFQILGDLVNVPEGNGHDEISRDQALWHEWEEASRGKRQLVWSRGLRDLLGLNDERTDEEIANSDDLGGDVLEYLHAEWYPCRLAGKVVQLLEAAEADDTGEALAALLNRLASAERDRQRQRE